MFIFNVFGSQNTIKYDTKKQLKQILSKQKLSTIDDKYPFIVNYNDKFTMNCTVFREQQTGMLQIVKIKPNLIKNLLPNQLQLEKNLNLLFLGEANDPKNNNCQILYFMTVIPRNNELNNKVVQCTIGYNASLEISYTKNMEEEIFNKNNYTIEITNIDPKSINCVLQYNKISKNTNNNKYILIIKDESNILYMDQNSCAKYQNDLEIKKVQENIRKEYEKIKQNIITEYEKSLKSKEIELSEQKYLIEKQQEKIHEINQILEQKEKDNKSFLKDIQKIEEEKTILYDQMELHQKLSEQYKESSDKYQQSSDKLSQQLLEEQLFNKKQNNQILEINQILENEKNQNQLLLKEIEKIQKIEIKQNDKREQIQNIKEQSKKQGFFKVYQDYITISSVLLSLVLLGFIVQKKIRKYNNLDRKKS